MTSLRSQLYRFFDDSLFRPDSLATDGNSGSWYPAVDIYEKDDKVVIMAELPGMEKKDISLDFKNGMLTLKGERNHEKELKEKDFYRKEISSGKFVRSFSLPVDVDVDKIEAEFKDGLLTIEVPKPEGQKPKQITVN
jgi:HSP20 family protein